jgi:Kef-type K+ transport system membrane component KefB
VTHFFFAGPTWLGEVMAGFILGPATLDIVPMTAELQTVGQLALMVVLFERGLHTNLASIAQCGLLGMIMAILGITLSMILSVVALRTNGHPFIESTCAACAVSTTIVGLVDIGWTRRQVSIMNSCSSLTSKVLDAATTMNALLILLVLTVERSFDPSRMWHHPPSEWWVCVQPLLFAMAFILVSIIFRANLNFFCLKTVIGVFFPPKKAPEHELYNALEFFQVKFAVALPLTQPVMSSACPVVPAPVLHLLFFWSSLFPTDLVADKARVPDPVACLSVLPLRSFLSRHDVSQVTFMTAFALAFGVLASLVKVPTIVGIFLAGLCFGGSEQCRESWIRNTRNLTHWLSRIFFTCSIGFLMPKTMWSRSAVLNGWELASAAFFGSFIGGALGSLPVLMKEKSTLSNVVLCGSSMAYSGEVCVCVCVCF